MIGWEPPVANAPDANFVAIPVSQQRNWLCSLPGRGEVRRRPNPFLPTSEIYKVFWRPLYNFPFIHSLNQQPTLTSHFSLFTIPIQI